MKHIWITKNQNWNAPIKADQINCSSYAHPETCWMSAQISWLIEAYRVRERDQVPGEFGLDVNRVHQIWLMVHKPMNQLEESEPISCLFFPFWHKWKNSLWRGKTKTAHKRCADNPEPIQSTTATTIAPPNKSTHPRTDYTVSAPTPYQRSPNDLVQHKGTSDSS